MLDWLHTLTLHHDPAFVVETDPDLHSPLTALQMWEQFVDHVVDTAYNRACTAGADPQVGDADQSAGRYDTYKGVTTVLLTTTALNQPQLATTLQRVHTLYLPQTQ